MSVTTGMLYLFQHFERLYVADARKRVYPRAVRLSVASFEHVRYAQPTGGFHYLSGDVHSHLFALYHARACEQEEVA